MVRLDVEALRRRHTCGGDATDVDMRARTTHKEWSSVSVGLIAWPIVTCSNKDAGKRERKTPTLSEKQNRQQKQKQERKKENTMFQDDLIPSQFKSLNQTDYKLEVVRLTALPASF